MSRRRCAKTRHHKKQKTNKQNKSAEHRHAEAAVPVHALNCLHRDVREFQRGKGRCETKPGNTSAQRGNITIASRRRGRIASKARDGGGAATR